MPGILYVVATPIGNLEDVTLRALRILREVSVIAAEDTRRTARLLQHYSISTPTTSLHEHNEYARTPGLVQRLLGGESIALVSDAGTPGVSDPGSRLVAAAHAANIPVLPVPGPSAAIAAVSASGVESDGFVFAGFPPSRPNDRRKWLRRLATESRAIVLYEAPHRIIATLRDVAAELGDRTVAIGRELTKKHEELVVRPITHWLRHPPRAVGEFVLVVWPTSARIEEDGNGAEDSTLAEEYRHMTETAGLARREAIHAVAERFRVSARRVFQAIENDRSSGERPS